LPSALQLPLRPRCHRSSARWQATLAGQRLLKSGSRYYIVEILWDSETPVSPIPQEYLPKH
jgi:hypothetical protein